MADHTFASLLRQLQRACHDGDRKFTAKTIALFAFDHVNSHRFQEFVARMDERAMRFFHDNVTVTTSTTNAPTIVVGMKGPVV